MQEATVEPRYKQKKLTLYLNIWDSSKLGSHSPLIVHLMDKMYLFLYDAALKCVIVKWKTGVALSNLSLLKTIRVSLIVDI